MTDQAPGAAVEALVIVRDGANGPGVPLAKVKDEGETVAEIPVAVEVGPMIVVESE